MGNVNPPDSKPSLVKVPSNYPMVPQPGKVSILFDANKNDLYHKFDANDYDNGNGFGFTQPYVYRYPTDRQIGFGVGSGVDDVVRVTKFVASGRGLMFVAKQFLLQGFQPFDETNIYNPTEVILSAASNLTYGILGKPKRHLDTSGGLLGGLAGLVGIQVSRSQPPPSTVAAGDGSGGSSEGKLFGGFSLLGNAGGNREAEVLPVRNFGEGAGLLRAKDANRARSILQTRWGADSSQAGGGGFTSFLKGIVKSVIPQVFGSDKQNYEQRADDIAYDWMIKYYNDNTAINRVTGVKSGPEIGISFMGFSLKKPNTFRLGTQMTNAVTEQFKQRFFKTKEKTYLYKDEVFVQGEDEQSNTLKIYKDSYYKDNSEGLEGQRDTYFDVKSWKPVDGESPIETAYKDYSEDGKSVKSTDLVGKSFYNETYEGLESEFYPSFDNINSKKANNRSVSQNTKLNDVSTDDTPASRINNSLQEVIKNIARSGIYSTNITNKDNFLLLSGNPSKQGYDRLHDIAKTPYNMKNNPNSVESTYYNDNVRTVDSIINPNKNIGLAGNGRPDKINTLTILDNDKKVKEILMKEYTEWKPYEDDLIAFFFYDVVNGKYIPFRATVKGISESNNALWDELRFVGRADAIYSYSGFTRNLTFSFTVVVNSLLELYPVWKRINYIASSVKPSGYTKKVQNDNATNRFVIPPMFMLTIGDLYKYQPVVMTAVTMAVPDNAVWEIVPENSTEDWSHMANMIKSSVPKGRIGQVPREVEVTVACNLLEKERPQVGRSHYAHTVVNDNYDAIVGEEYLPSPEKFSINIREDSEEFPKG